MCQSFRTHLLQKEENTILMNHVLSFINLPTFPVRTQVSDREKDNGPKQEEGQIIFFLSAHQGCCGAPQSAFSLAHDS